MDIKFVWKLWCVFPFDLRLKGGKVVRTKCCSDTNLQAVQKPAQTSGRLGCGQCWLQRLDPLSGGLLRWDAYMAYVGKCRSLKILSFFQMSAEALLNPSAVEVRWRTWLKRPQTWKGGAPDLLHNLQKLTYEDLLTPFSISSFLYSPHHVSQFFQRNEGRT